MVKLTILTDNVAGGKFCAEHGLSYLIEVNNYTLLFDTGHSDTFIRNAHKMGIPLHDKVDQVVLSHGHWDHGDGLRFISNKPLITHPQSFMKRYRANDHSFIGLMLSKEMVEKLFDLTTSKEAVEIHENVFFLGEIPRNNAFESLTTPFVDESHQADFVPDDSALAIIENGKLIIITGCSHAGICNICEHAKEITGIHTIEAVIGGFHLKYNNEQTQKTIAYFKREKIDKLYPSHCTELAALSAFAEHFNISQVKTGRVLEF